MTCPECATLANERTRRHKAEQQYAEAAQVIEDAREAIRENVALRRLVRWYDPHLTDVQWKYSPLPSDLIEVRARALSEES